MKQDDFGEDFKVKDMWNSANKMEVDNFNCSFGVFDNLEQFKSSYERNNKNNGKKNLKCFPQCKQAGHVSHTYCGAPLSVSYIYGPQDLRNRYGLNPLTNGGSLIKCYATFVCLNFDEENHELVAKLKIGSEVSKELLDGKLTRSRRDSKTRTLPFIKGCYKGEEGYGYYKIKQHHEFNKENLGWHYGWRSSKRVNNASHCLRVFVFVEPSPNYLKCIDSFDSPSFTIYSRRKRGKVQAHHYGEMLKAQSGPPSYAQSGSPSYSLFSKSSSMFSIESNNFNNGLFNSFKGMQLDSTKSLPTSHRLKRYISSSIMYEETSNNTSQPQKRRILKHFTSSFTEGVKESDEIPELHVI